MCPGVKSIPLVARIKGEEILHQYHIACQAGFEDSLGFSDINNHLDPKQHVKKSRVHMQEGCSGLLSHQVLGSVPTFF